MDLRKENLCRETWIRKTCRLLILFYFHFRDFSLSHLDIFLFPQRHNEWAPQSETRLKLLFADDAIPVQIEGRERLIHVRLGDVDVARRLPLSKLPGKRTRKKLWACAFGECAKSTFGYLKRDTLKTLNL